MDYPLTGRWNRFLYILLFSMVVAGIIFIWVRIPRRNLELLHDRHGTIESTKTEIDELCIDKPPYTIIPQTSGPFLLCLSKKEKHVSLICPAGSHFNPEKQICEEVKDKNVCLNRPDGSKVSVADTSPFVLPYNRIYYKCHHQKILDIFRCPDDRPIFDGNECVSNNVCYNKPTGWILPHESDSSSYYLCENNQMIKKRCSENEYFSHNRCVQKDICHDQRDFERLPLEDDPNGFIECYKRRGNKRKCNLYASYHRVKKQCVKHNICVNKANQRFELDNVYLKRSHRGVYCDENEVEYPIKCDQPTPIYDAQADICRKLDNFKDIKDGRVYAINGHEYYDNTSSEVKRIGPYETLSATQGLVRSICWNKPDRTKLIDKNNIQGYMECHNGNPIHRTCREKDDVFLVDRCVFSPCLKNQQPLTSGPLPHDKGSRYACQENSLHTFIYTCPRGLKPAGSTYSKCSLDPEFRSNGISNTFPKVLTSRSFLDSNNTQHTCTGERVLHSDHDPLTILEEASLYQFQCAERPCGRINYSSWPLVPLSPSEGVECFENKIQRHVVCDPGLYINYEKVFSGQYGLPDCLPDANQSNVLNKSRIDLPTLTVTLFNRGQNHAILEDEFREIGGVKIFRNEELEKSAEVIGQTLSPIVSFETNKSPRDVKCSPGEISIPYPGFPKYYKNCDSNKKIICKLKHIFLSGYQERVKIYPVHSNCKLFALGKTLSNYRLFKCPAHSPYFNYTLKKCVNEIVEGQFLCEEFYWKNYQLVSDPFQHELPPPTEEIE